MLTDLRLDRNGLGYLAAGAHKATSGGNNTRLRARQTRPHHIASHVDPVFLQSINKGETTEAVFLQHIA